MLNPRIPVIALALLLASCCSNYTVEPPKRKLDARITGNSVTLVNDLEVPVAMISPTGNGTQVIIAAGATSEPLSFTVERWKILKPGAADEVEVKDENPLLQQQMIDIVLLLKAADLPRREAHMIIGPCFFASTGPTTSIVRVSQFPLSGTRIPLCP